MRDRPPSVAVLFPRYGYRLRSRRVAMPPTLISVLKHPAYRERYQRTKRRLGKAARATMSPHIDLARRLRRRNLAHADPSGRRRSLAAGWGTRGPSCRSQPPRYESSRSQINEERASPDRQQPNQFAGAAFSTLVPDASSPRARHHSRHRRRCDTDYCRGGSGIARPLRRACRVWPC